ncbi:hypothetical protein [Trichloromonas sp.]|jgi:hypothetical protein|uniref:hypothetical protein n=1 Tax=Trichloromonas sp. TaxID=3069249 RepID=UPI002A42A425|nr:hypothetical protein [Trichloromonas sp.]
METKFTNFINENSDNTTYKQFMDDVRKAIIADFKYDKQQAIEYIKLYNKQFKKLWQNKYTPRESIVATLRPGFKIDDNYNKSIINDIDNDYEDLLIKIEKSKSDNVIVDIHNYYDKFSSTSYPNIMVANRLKKNYINLLNKYKEKFK